MAVLLWEHALVDVHPFAGQRSGFVQPLVPPSAQGLPHSGWDLSGTMAALESVT